MAEWQTQGTTSSDAVHSLDPKTSETGGVLRQLSDELGITAPVVGGYQRSDERIREDVCERLWHEPHVDVSEVTVEVKAGVVTLEGTVPYRQMKHSIEDIAASCRGVVDVENRIRVPRTGGSPPSSGAGIG